MPRWRIPPNASFRWREWDDESVLYHENSGDTHFLNAIGRRALERLGEAAMDEAELARALADDCDMPVDPAFVNTVERLVERFAELGLIEPVADGQPRPAPRSTVS